MKMKTKRENKESNLLRQRKREKEKVKYVKNYDVKHGEETKKTKKKTKGWQSTILLILSVVIVMMMTCIYIYKMNIIKIKALRKFKNRDDIILFDETYENEMLWGTYRSSLYMGLRTRLPKSLIAGLMWADPISINNVNNIRHIAKDEDKLKKYGWKRHDGKNFGIQEIIDKKYKIETQWIKKINNNGISSNVDWTLRINVNEKYRKKEREEWISMFFYMAEESGPGNVKDNYLNWEYMDSNIKYKEIEELMRGKNKDLGNWSLYINQNLKSDIELYKAGIPINSYHNITSIVQSLLINSFQYQHKIQGIEIGNIQFHLPKPDIWHETGTEQPNFVVYQIISKLPMSVDFIFIANGKETKITDERLNEMTGDNFRRLLDKYNAAFDIRFKKTFEINEEIDGLLEMTKQALSNTLGSIGYFYGNSKIGIKDKNNEYKIYENWKSSLFTAVPSRSFFPRGFLWDEGFHQLLIQRWDMTLSMDIINHWLQLLNIEGWIPREQILGEEARSRVPEEFIVQELNVANPPTLFLAISKFIPASENNETYYLFLKTIWPRLEKWFDWYIKKLTPSLSLDNKEYIFQWKSRNNNINEFNPKTLDSGLDDYPRSSHLSHMDRHLDLRCWIALISDVMLELSKTLKIKNDKYENIRRDLWNISDLNRLHLDEETGWYLDYGLHTEDIKMEKKINEVNQVLNQAYEIRKILNEPKLQYIRHYGYVSLFPMIIKIFNNESNDIILKNQLKFLEDENYLWTLYGIRSLSNTSSFYNKYNTLHDPPYWRGAIWINMNYLILNSLHHYTLILNEPYSNHCKKLYEKLRCNLLNNTLNEFKRTGYLWEQYDDKNGRGKGSHPFTGWTSLIVLIAEHHNHFNKCF